jgi:hypothetical protein
MLPMLILASCGSQNASVKATQTICTAENVIPGLSPEIDLKFVINKINDERVTLVCAVLNNATKDVLAMHETTYFTEDDCQVPYPISSEDFLAEWDMKDGASTRSAVFKYTSTEHENKTVVFSSDACITTNVN